MVKVTQHLKGKNEKGSRSYGVLCRAFESAVVLHPQESAVVVYTQQSAVVLYTQQSAVVLYPQVAEREW